MALDKIFLVPHILQMREVFLLALQEQKYKKSIPLQNTLQIYIMMQIICKFNPCLYHVLFFWHLFSHEEFWPKKAIYGYGIHPVICAPLARLLLNRLSWCSHIKTFPISGMLLSKMWKLLDLFIWERNIKPCPTLDMAIFVLIKPILWTGISTMW